MLKKSNRIQLKKDFNKIFREGKKANTDFLFFRILKTDRELSRFGFVISKKISKSSATRNGIKRSLTEAIRKNLPNIKQGFDIVMIVKADFSSKKQIEKEKIVICALKKVLLFN